MCAQFRDLLRILRARFMRKWDICVVTEKARVDNRQMSARVPRPKVLFYTAVQNLFQAS